MRKIINWYTNLHIAYKLLPFLFLYLFICVAFPKNLDGTDQRRYLLFAQNILQGFYSPPQEMNLWNGPGYPLILSVFLFFKVPVSALSAFNAILLYISLIIAYKTFCLYVSKKKAFMLTLLLGLYFPMFEEMRQILTETLAWFLVSAICYLFAKSKKEPTYSWKLILLCSFSIAFLAMTKVIFGYVVIVMLLISVLMWLFPIFRNVAKKSTVIFTVAFIFCLPWLCYTYSITKRVFYWTNSGSMSLYTMSTPYENESGQWYGEDLLLKNPNHALFIDSITNLSPLLKDDAYKTAAIKNIKNHPKKYAYNFISNVGRLLFFPSNYAPDTIWSYYPFIPNMFLVVFIFLGVVISIRYYKKVPQEIIFLFLFILIYLMGSTFVSAYRRMFYITVPFWLLFFAYVFNNIITIKLNRQKE